MRRRIAVTVAVVSGMALGLAFGIAPAVGKQGRGGQSTPTTTTVDLSCNVSLTAVPPNGKNYVPQPPDHGWQWGPTSCSPSSVGPGAIGDYFTVPDSGDTMGTFGEYFRTGELHGTFDLTPQEGTFGGGSFSSQSWTGTITVSRGTGAYRGSSSPQAGTLDCNSPDSVHLYCTENVTVSVVSNAAH